MNDSVGAPERRREQRPDTGEHRPALPADQSRIGMMRRQAALSATDRIALFEALSRDAAWAGTAVRIR